MDYNPIRRVFMKLLFLFYAPVFKVIKLIENLLIYFVLSNKIIIKYYLDIINDDSVIYDGRLSI